MSKAWTGQGQKGGHGSGERVWARIIPNPKLKLLEQCREVMRFRVNRFAPRGGGAPNIEWRQAGRLSYVISVHQRG